MALRFTPLANFTGPAGLVQQPVTPEQSVLARKLLEAKRLSLAPDTPRPMRAAAQQEVGNLESALIARKDQSRLNELPPGPMPPPGDVTIVEKGAVQERPPSSFGTLATGDQIREAFQRRQQQMAPPETMVAEASPVPTSTNSPTAYPNSAKPYTNSPNAPPPTAVDMANMQGGAPAPAPAPQPAPQATMAYQAPVEPKFQAGAKLPAGMRNNNPGNLKWSGSAWQRKNFPGMVGPSDTHGAGNTDQGDPQIAFRSHADGMKAAVRLARAKYHGGKNTVYSLIAGPGGWTPGYAPAAQNIARNMGVGVYDPINLDNPQTMGRFMRALLTQEHGSAAQAYSDDFIMAAVTGGAAAEPEITDSNWISGGGGPAGPGTGPGANGAGGAMAYAENTMTPQGDPQSALMALLAAQQPQQPMPYSSPDWVPLQQAAPRTELAQAAPIAQGGRQVAFTPQVASPDQIDAQGALGAAMLARAQRSDAAHPMQALGNTAQAAAGAFGMQRARQMADARQGALAAALMAARGGGATDQLYGVDPRAAFELDQQRIAAEAEARQAQLQRQWEMEDYARKKQIDQQYAAPDKPTSVDEYEYARKQAMDGGTPPEQFPDYTSWQRDNKKAGATTIEGNKYGTIPSGFQIVEGDGTARMEPIPGSPAAQDAEAAQQKEVARQQLQQATGGLVTEDIGRAYEMAKEYPSWRTGPMGAALSNVPGSGAHDLSNLLDTIKANTAFDALQQMRQASPTGGALGAVSERELKLLEATKGALAQSQSEGQLLYNLARLNDQTLDVVHGPSWRETSPGMSIFHREAQQAIANGKDPAAVNARLKQLGLPPIEVK